VCVLCVCVCDDVCVSLLKSGYAPVYHGCDLSCVYPVLRCVCVWCSIDDSVYVRVIVCGWPMCVYYC
jgi:hypothetical protein